MANLNRLTRPRQYLAVVNIIALTVFLFATVTNQVVIASTSSALGGTRYMAKLLSLLGGGLKLSGDAAADAMKLVLSAGVPAVYGAEMGVDFEHVQPAIDKMKIYDPTYGAQKIVLAGDDLKRYIEIALKISCEYCCGAKSIIRENGEAACGCAHSQAMRGLAAYLLKNHSQMSNDEILRELARWKGMYFPKQMMQKMSGHLQSGSFTPDTAALIMGMKLPKYGQTNGAAPLPSEIKDMPGMVGGC
ncbi:hypothetical protein EPN28_04720 [Patescibacteria group bacterium]|nr:MAG: hypothetical protein EPN28_04720 [Patescibacteria group bacterium]